MFGGSLGLSFLALGFHPCALARFDLFDACLNFFFGLRHGRSTRPTTVTAEDAVASRWRIISVSINIDCIRIGLRTDCISAAGRFDAIGTDFTLTCLLIGQVVGNPVEPVGEGMTGEIQSGVGKQLPVSGRDGVALGRCSRRGGRRS
ncbi:MULTISPECIES: hypothetical protein [Brevibacterium]|uniref:hypothetical protein n=1 Tax=Brevibacterium TaxID=1696 RepID=UPI00137930C2|nr:MULTISPECIES: hypothetical protein [Brevibacterium]HHX46093.1 hypothetical protein [Brevibacterium sp.]